MPKSDQLSPLALRLLESAPLKEGSFSLGDRPLFDRGYVEAMYFTEEESWKEEKGHDDFPLSPEAQNKVASDCADFREKAGSLLDSALLRQDYGAVQAGRDFWFTRNGHGVGFWDRDQLDEGNLGDKLTEIAKGCGETWAVVGDDGSVYLT